MNKERREHALKRNIALTEGALEHAYALLKSQDPTALAFPERRDKYIRDMKNKLQAYQEELRQLEVQEK